MSNIHLSPKQNVIIDSLKPEDKEWLTGIIIDYGHNEFVETFPMYNVEIAKKSFFRLFLLRELWYEVLTYEEFDQGMIITMKLS